jgi:hypothetical protein
MEGHRLFGDAIHEQHGRKRPIAVVPDVFNAGAHCYRLAIPAHYPAYLLDRHAWLNLAKLLCGDDRLSEIRLRIWLDVLIATGRLGVAASCALWGIRDFVTAAGNGGE